MRKIIAASIVLAVQLALGAQTRKNPDAPQEFRNITYLSVDGHDLKLDVFTHASSSPAPVIVYFHGGGWVSNSRPKSWTGFRFFLSLGFSVVNVDYRLAKEGLAPAAVQDARQALAWVAAHAREYHFDTTRIVTYGTSAGGHLALMAGIVPQDAPFDLSQNGTVPRAVAVLDFYGITDVTDLLAGKDKRGWANTWIGNGQDRETLAKKMSPLSYVAKNTPPVFIVHGDSDPTVPFTQAVRLKKALDENQVPNGFFTVPGGKHGKFSKEQMAQIESAIRDFLISRGIVR